MAGTKHRPNNVDLKDDATISSHLVPIPVILKEDNHQDSAGHRVDKLITPAKIGPKLTQANSNLFQIGKPTKSTCQGLDNLATPTTRTNKHLRSRNLRDKETLLPRSTALYKDPRGLLLLFSYITTISGESFRHHFRHGIHEEDQRRGREQHRG